MKLAGLIALLVKAALRIAEIWRGRKNEAAVLEEVLDDVRLADQAEALRIERDVDAVPERLPDAPTGTTPAERIRARRGRRPD